MEYLIPHRILSAKGHAYEEIQFGFHTAILLILLLFKPVVRKHRCVQLV